MSTEETAVDDSDRLQPGYVIDDRYELREPLGEGGFAVVYEAYDRTIDRPIALKVLNLDRLASGGEPVELIRERFLREARLAAKIRHPSVIEIYDFGVLDDSEQPYMMMEFLEGKDLDQEIKHRGYIEAERLLPLFVQALEGLGEAHQQGVVHKDLKPANLFLTRPGTASERLKIVDFGIAHVHEEVDERLTKTGAFTGTPYYLSQEYLQEQQVRPEMDVYQMGLILVEALSGERVIVAETAYQAAIKHISRELRIADALLEGPLGEVIEQAIAFEPDERFSTGAEFAQALRQVDPSAVQFHPDTMATAAADAVQGQGEVSGTARTAAQFGGDKVSANTGEQHRETGIDETGGGSGDSEPLSVDTISAAFGSSWPLKVLGGLGIATLLLVGILVAVIVTDGSDEASEAVSQQQAVQEDEPRQPRQDDPQVVEDSADEAQPDEALAGQDAREVTVALTSAPSEAEVTADDGQRLGETPLELELGEGERKELTVQRPGYHVEQVVVDESSGPEMEVTLRERPPRQPEPRAAGGDAAETAGSGDDTPEREPAHQREQADEPEHAAESDESEEPAEEQQDWAMPGAGGDDEGEAEEEEDEDDGGYRLAP